MYQPYRTAFVTARNTDSRSEHFPFYAPRRLQTHYSAAENQHGSQEKPQNPRKSQRCVASFVIVLPASKQDALQPPLSEGLFKVNRASSCCYFIQSLPQTGPSVTLALWNDVYMLPHSLRQHMASKFEILTFRLASLCLQSMRTFNHCRNIP